MNFDEFWSKIRLMHDLSLHTLSQRKEFKSSHDARYGVIEIIPSTNQPRVITKDQFYVAWSIAKKSTSPFKTAHYQDVTYNSSYVVTIMKYFLDGEKIE